MVWLLACHARYSEGSLPHESPNIKDILMNCQSEKTCTNCNKTLDISSFYIRNKKNKNGFIYKDISKYIKNVLLYEE